MSTGGWLALIIAAAVISGLIRGWSVHAAALIAFARATNASHVPSSLPSVSELMYEFGKAFAATALLGLAILTAAHTLK